MIEYQIALKVWADGPPFVAHGMVNFKEFGEKTFKFTQTHDVIGITITDEKESYYSSFTQKTPEPITKQQAEHALKYLLLIYVNTVYAHTKTELSTTSPEGGGHQA